ncbi:lytic transglycosylase domain-containing protein [Ruegeria sp.]
MDRITPLIIAAAAIISPAEAATLARFQAHIKEAAQRYSIPESWFRAVILAESNGDSQAISPKGAMGLMQLMPGTWKELRDEHGLGTNPYNPRTNILAGTAYLKAMYERFGSSGLFAAYNAGQVEKPGRYGGHLRDGKPLPAETRACAAGTREAPGGTPETTVTKTKSGPSTTQNSPKIAFDTRLFCRFRRAKTAKFSHEMASFS